MNEQVQEGDITGTVEWNKPGWRRFAVRSSNSGEVYEASYRENNRVPNGHHHCILTEGTVVTFKLEPSHTGNKIRAVEVRLSPEYTFKVAETELSNVAEWKPEGYGVLARNECGCNLFIHAKNIDGGEAPNVGDLLEHRVYFDKKVGKHSAVNAMHAIAPYVPIYRVWSPTEVEPSRAPDFKFSTMRVLSGESAEENGNE
jgi:cold shock CspA family protein